MMQAFVQHALGLGGHALLAALAGLTAILMVRRGALSLSVRIAIVAALAGASLLPLFAGLSLAEEMRGRMGDLSIMSLLLLAARLTELVGKKTRWFPLQAREALLVAVTAAGLLLYPFALGWTTFDPYRFGFQTLPLLAALAVYVLVQWRFNPAAAVAVLACVIAFNLGLLESTNLWDYLLDVWLMLAAVIYLAASLAMYVWNAKRSTALAEQASAG